MMVLSLDDWRNANQRIGAIRRKLENVPSKDREVALVITKLEEAELWLTKVTIR